jgi:hypothetical protein
MDEHARATLRDQLLESAYELISTLEQEPQRCSDPLWQTSAANWLDSADSITAIEPASLILPATEAVCNQVIEHARRIRQ